MLLFDKQAQGAVGYTNVAAGQSIGVSIDGHAGQATQAVPAGTSSVSWTVRVTGTGSLPVRVESSTGLARTKTIQLTETVNALFGR